MSKKLCFHGVQVLTSQGLGSKQDFFVEDGRWVSFLSDAQEIKADGCWVLPGFHALGVDFQEPIRDDIYTFRDGFEAMRRGGFASALYESHANPVDELRTLTALQDCCDKSGLSFQFLGALSVGHEGKALSEMLELASGGVVGYGDGNHLPTSLRFLRLALEYAGMTGLRCFFQPTAWSIVGKGCVHEGHYADMLGMKGIPAQAETIAVHQILEMAGWLQVPVHLKQLTCAESLNLVRNARKRGVDVTCDVSVYHLLFDDSILSELDTHTHILPPLRTAEDLDALWNGLADGSVQAISCAHVPVLPQDKEVNFEDSMPGAISLEVAFAALLPVATKRLPGGLVDLVRLLVEGPAKVCGIPSRALTINQAVPFFVFDPRLQWKPTGSDFAGQVQNSPMLGKSMQGRVRGVCFDGEWKCNL